MTSVIVFGPTGQVGSVTALTAAEKGATVWLAMRDTAKSIPGLTEEAEKSGSFHRVQADLRDPESVAQAVKTSGAKRAFIYLMHGAPDHQKGSITALKEAGIEFVVFLSSFTIPTDIGLREVPPTDLIPYFHSQVEANLDDVFGSDYVAVRPGAFVTNILRDKGGIIANDVRQFGGGFRQDNITPGDMGRVSGDILVSGPRNGQKKVYLYGPKILSLHDSVAEIGRILGKDLKITAVGPEEGYEQYISSGVPPVFAKYMVDLMSAQGSDKWSDVQFPNYEEGVNNVELYTGKPATSFEDWVKENKSLFGA